MSIKTEEAVSLSWEVLTASVEEALAAEEFSQAEELALAALEEAEDFEPGDRRLSITLECLSEIHYMQGSTPKARRFANGCSAFTPPRSVRTTWTRQ